MQLAGNSTWMISCSKDMNYENIVACGQWRGQLQKELEGQGSRDRDFYHALLAMVCSFTWILFFLAGLTRFHSCHCQIDAIAIAVHQNHLNTKRNSQDFVIEFSRTSRGIFGKRGD